MGADQELAFPIIVKTGVNEQGNTIRYYFNYSDQPVSFVHTQEGGTELLTGTAVEKGQTIELERWGIQIIEQQG